MIRKSEVIHKTKSVCPDCLNRIDAYYIARGEDIWFCKKCSRHGEFETRVWKGRESFMRNLSLPSSQSPEKGIREPRLGCPYDCGICRNHKQKTCCVLLEVCDTCNLRCPVCFASSEGESSEGGFPSQEEIASWYDLLMESGGPFNIQLSGGEPTMREDLCEIIKLGRKKGFVFFQLNTNGIRIGQDPKYLRKLKEAGLNTVFLQFDSLQPQDLIRIRGRDILEEKRVAIENCRKEGLGVVLVPTVMRGCNDGHLGEIIEYAVSQMPTVRGVHFQPMSYFGRYEKTPGREERIVLPELLELLEEQTKGKIRVEDFSYGSAEHPLCSANADYRIEKGNWRAIKKERKRCCSCSSDAARDAVAQKWSLTDFASKKEEKEDCCSDLSSLDAFLEERQKRSLAISAMAFQDAWNLDLERLQRCYIHTFGPDGRLIPFCAYNLSSSRGVTLYRNQKSRICPLERSTGRIRPGSTKLTKRGVELAGLKAGDRLLDIGCGSGESVAFLRKHCGIEARGIDASSEMVNSARKRDPSLPVSTGFAEEEGIFSPAPDAVLMECVFSGITDKRGLLKRIHAGLRPGGKMILSDLYEREGEDIPESVGKEGFRVLAFEDHSAVLKDSAIALIMEYGSLEAFREKICVSCKKCCFSEEREWKKTGYYLLVAEKI